MFHRQTRSSETSSQYKLKTHITNKSVSSGESTTDNTGHTLNRLLTPRLATSLGSGPNSDAPVPPPPSSWTSRLPRNPFPFRNKAESVHHPPTPPQPPVLPALDTKASMFSLHSQNDDEICVQPASLQTQGTPPPARKFSLPVIPQGKPHPSETLDLPSAFSPLESSNRSIKFADSAASEAGSSHQR